MFSSTVSPNDPIESQPTIGIIGMGAMGKMYAKLFAKAGWKKIHVCDRPENYASIREYCASVPNVQVLKDGHAVARSSDFMMYSVEAEFIGRVVQEYGPSTKMGAIVSGQTSVKAPEKEAFEKSLPADAHIISIHSLHGPTVSTLGQPLIIINHRGSADALALVENLLRSFKSRYVYLTYEEHDLVTANTQAVTHAAFLSMGTAWASEGSYPWEQGLYVGGIETVKVNLALRIYSNAWHVYAGLAILNPKAREQINQYAQSATELYKMMLEAGSGLPKERVDRSTELVSERESKLRQRLEWARAVVFGDPSKTRNRKPILLSEDILDKFSLGRSNTATSITVPDPCSSSHIDSSPRKANSHLSLLAMVDCWAHLNINPFHHLDLAATPLFRLFLGVAEHLFLNPTLMDMTINSAIYDTWHRANDLEFVVAARGWSQCVKFMSFEVYRKRFDETRIFFEPRFEEAGLLGSKMIAALMASGMDSESTNLSA
ncbi:prephenate dehydrogenase [Lentinula raphanica]|uniref:Prephenate dehydrogenase n=1 Tax=Lentinula raphanica TaxID=153919 RepID=A0AA38UJC6_9AGAR|nr:prephenate dehydrogenase [Lentinula raphanica]KAJ3778675.1 prephenate dehydrogenase [Lentinula raphanica]KAJ3829978.1 prephenate dehydrogenase [Lentinula raphanica]KAJ3840572.1 prephenate dehydrogenase [Lentinula raphanica]KAJ3973808.1 prephenate dehydrogenase [Lentinula raphanica]